MAANELPLTARVIAFGAFGGTLALTTAMLGLHALFTYMGMDDGGTIRDLLVVMVGSVTTTLGMVVAALFGSRAPSPPMD